MPIRVKPPILYLAFLIGGLAVFTLHATLDLGGQGLNGFFNDGVYNLLMFGAALALLTRALTRRHQRAAWLAMGTGVLCWSLGELYYSIFIAGTSAEASGTVSLADGLFLAMYPCMYVGLGLLCKNELRRVRIGIWLDGLIAGLAAATVAAVLILPPIISHAGSDLASVTVSSAYPLGDLLLLLFAIGALGMVGWRPSAVSILIAAGMLVSTIADSIYLYQTSLGRYQSGTWLDCLWPTAAILIAIAAWTPYSPLKRRVMRSWEIMAVPTIGLAAAVGVLIYGNLAHQLQTSVLALAAATVIAVGVHLIATLRENLALVASSEQLSLTDALTGLGNRRRLMRDLAAACRAAKTTAPWELLLYDLDGFKGYNDAFGHPAGDKLLRRLSQRLQAAVASHGTAYRLGGDEFCVLLEPTQGERPPQLVQRSVQALCERGPGFSITASHGAVSFPLEMCSPSAVMQLADQRLYRRKEEIAAQRLSLAGDSRMPALFSSELDLAHTEDA